jgi:hypothetical protein
MMIMKSVLNKRPKAIAPLLFSFLIICSLTLSAQQALKCPRAITNCRGLCGWNIDSDHDGYCDYSAFTPDVAKKLANRRDSIANIKLNKEKARLDSIAAAEKARITAEKMKANAGNNNQEKEVIVDEAPTKQPAKGNCGDCAFIKPSPPDDTTPQAMPSKALYDLIPIGTISLILYLLTFFLSRIGTITKSTHRKIWNVLLLVTFLVTGLLGLFLVVQLNYNLLFDWVRPLLYWHVEFGIGMACISIFHILWHLKYFLNLFKTAKKKAAKEHHD